MQWRCPQVRCATRAPESGLGRPRETEESGSRAAAFFLFFAGPFEVSSCEKASADQDRGDRGSSSPQQFMDWHAMVIVCARQTTPSESRAACLEGSPSNLACAHTVRPTKDAIVGLVGAHPYTRTRHSEPQSVRHFSGVPNTRASTQCTDVWLSCSRMGKFSTGR